MSKIEKWNIVIKEPFMNCDRIYPLQQRKISELIAYLKDNKNVQKIIIFGSSVTSRCNINSDVDIYVELKEKENLLKDKYFNFLYDLWTNFDVDDRLYNEIQKKGVVVYEK